ncbi:MAG: hypothetical protein JWP84_4563 [Tardiphaga sp.]|nr:hypothetical protein [Tardiphaga sp.]
MSDHQADQNSDLSGNSVDPQLNASAAPPEDASDAVRTDSPKLAPEHGGAPKAEAPKVHSPHTPGKIMIMSPQRERSWEDFIDAEPQPEPEVRAETPHKRRISMVAAVIALAAVTGAVGGSLATAGLGHFFGSDDSKTASRALEESIMRIDADVAALKINVERAGKQAAAQFGKTADRLDKVEKAQAEPAAKLAKLSETVDKLRATLAPVPTPVASAPAKDVTGSIAAPVPTPAPKPEIARLPVLEGWVLHDVANGGATIEGRQGFFEVYAGDPVPALGRIDAIRKQDGRWTVVTSKGLIVAR